MIKRVDPLSVAENACKKIVPHSKKFTLLLMMAMQASAIVHAQKEIASAANISFPFKNKRLNSNTVITSASEQNALKIINGKVTSADMKPLEGASVKIKGTDRGVTTNAEGVFRITMEDTDAVLVISFTGYRSEEVTLRNETTINIILTASENSLEQVVVIGYGTQRKSDLTGSVSQVRSRDLNAFPVINPVQGLQGKAAGVQITQNSGEPGNALSVRIRGGNSLRGNNEPLYVIDGFAIGDNPNALNPADIETVEILKDASATAIYGSRGANGVVLITTKKGKAGKSQVDFDSYYGVQQVIKKLPLLNASEFAGLANERAANDRVNPYFTQDEINAFGKGTDWQEELFRAAPIQSHSVTFSGGTDRTQYAVSGSYFRQQGIVLGSDYWRGSVRANINHKISNKFTLSYNNILSHIERSLINSDNGQRGNSIVSAILAAPPTIAPYDANGNYSVVNGYSFSPNALQNPLAMALELKNKLKENYILSNLSITYEPVKNLTLKVSAGIENNPTQRDFYSSRILAASPTGTASINHAQQYNILNENILNYTRNINKIHSITVTGGVTYQHQTNSGSSASASGFSTDVLQTNSLSSGTSPGIPNSSLTEWTLLSYLGRINYAYKSKYLITISDRADGSSRFGQNNKWGYFPSAAFAWKVSEEEFIKNSNVLSDLKFRASWGKTGSTALAPYQTLNTLNDMQVSFNNQLYIGFAPGAVLASSNLKWETTAQSNLGVDIAFLKNRLQLTVDVYDKNTSDLLAVVPLAPSYGYTSTVQNIGKIRNKGIEAGLNAVILENIFSWRVNANVSVNRNKVLKLANESDVFGAILGQPIGVSVNLVRVGYTVGVFYGYREDGLDNNGQIKYIDHNKDNVINESDKTIIGNPNPDFIYGISSNMEFKNFELNFFIQGVKGADIFNYNKSGSASSFYFGENQIKDVAGNTWNPQQPNAAAMYPKASTSTTFRESDRFVEDGSYLRLKNIQIAYNIKPSTAKGNWFKTAQVYVSSQNLLTVSNYSWYDPEMSTRGGGNSVSIGIDQTGFPNAKTFTAGIRLTL